ncbi:MAG: hypothetical protein V1792_15125 [Pseudomonadota bacterium]
MSSVTYSRLVAMLRVGKNTIRARRPGLRKTVPKLSLEDDRQDAGPTEEGVPSYIVGRASLPVIFKGGRRILEYGR